MRSLAFPLRRAAVAVVLATAAACGDSPVAPDTSPLDGTWTLAVANLADSKVSCEVSPFTVTLATSAAALTGSSEARADSHSECAVVGGTPPYSTPFYPTGAMTGDVSGSAISLVLYDGSWSFAGMRSGSTIRGTATYRSTDSAGPVERTGAFTLRRAAR